MRYLLVIFFTLAVTSLTAQDVIFKVDGEKINAKVREIGLKEVHYSPLDSLGSQQSLPKREVLMILYQNGSHEIFNTGEEKKWVRDTKEDEEDQLPQNSVSFDHLGLLLGGQLQASVGGILVNDLLTYRIPFTYGLPWGEFNLQYSLGLDLRFYHSGFNAVSHFVGPSFRYSYFYNSTFNNGRWVMPEQEGRSGDFYLTNGVLFKFTKRINVAFSFSVGTNISRPAFFDGDLIYRF